MQSVVGGGGHWQQLTLSIHTSKHSTSEDIVAYWCNNSSEMKLWSLHVCMCPVCRLPSAVYWLDSFVSRISLLAAPLDNNQLMWACHCTVSACHWSHHLRVLCWTQPVGLHNCIMILQARVSCIQFIANSLCRCFMQINLLHAKEGERESDAALFWRLSSGNDNCARSAPN